jgi:oxygen-independent coproporphyrinogen III oxidase
MVRDMVDMAREEGFAGLNLDLIYGLPRQTPESFANTIETALSLSPDRVACFGYAHVPWMKAHQKRIDEGTLPRAWDRFALFREAVRRFSDSRLPVDRHRSLRAPRRPAGAGRRRGTVAPQLHGLHHA